MDQCLIFTIIRDTKKSEHRDFSLDLATIIDDLGFSCTSFCETLQNIFPYKNKRRVISERTLFEAEAAST
jgi:hypothetical protein